MMYSIQKSQPWMLIGGQNCTLFDSRNPKTGEATLVKPKKLPFFKAGKAVNETVNASVIKK